MGFTINTTIMILTDTHTHLYDPKLAADEQQINRAIAAGVTRLYMPNCDIETIAPMLAIADAHPEHCLPMMGLHPTYVDTNYKQQLEVMEQWLSKRTFHAIGEIGLDYYWDLTFQNEQFEALATQLDWALKYDLATVLHTREATEDTIKMVRKKQNGSLRGVFHCFGGTVEEAKQIIDLGFYLGIGGVVTYKKSGLMEVLPQIPLEHIVLETDAPYLAPVPHRGKRNESAYIPFIAQQVADCYQTSIDHIAQVTTANAERLFRLPNR